MEPIPGSAAGHVPRIAVIVDNLDAAGRRDVAAGAECPWGPGVVMFFSLFAHGKDADTWFSSLLSSIDHGEEPHRTAVLKMTQRIMHMIMPRARLFTDLH